MSCIVATIKASDNIVVRCKHINKTTFAFVAALEPYNYIYCHKLL